MILLKSQINRAREHKILDFAKEVKKKMKNEEESSEELYVERSHNSFDK